MTAIGEVLRRERLRRNLTLEQISRQTKISVKLLEAIEAEDFDKLPGGVFTRSFVRQYAHVLGVDEAELVGELEHTLHTQDPLPSFRETTHDSVIRIAAASQWERTSAGSNSTLPSLALVVAVMLLCSAIYAWWQRSHHVVEPLSQSTSRPVEVQPASNALPGDSTSPRDTPAASAQASPVAQSVSDTRPAAAIQLYMTADEPVWIGAWADGKRVFYDTLQPNQSKSLDALERIRLLVGNAGALSITLNGKSIAPIGQKGQVRTVEFSPAGVQVSMPRSSAPDPL